MNRYYENYLALVYTILSNQNKIPNFYMLQNKQESKKRINEINQIRNAGGKTELEQLFPKFENKSHNKKLYVYDIDFNKLYKFESKKVASEKLHLNLYRVTKIDKPKMVFNRYIVSMNKINIKQIKPKDFLYVLDTGYPKGLFYIETLSGNYLSIDNRKESKIKKHDCKEAAILYLLDL